MPSISNLNESQVKLLDTMWAIDTDDEFKSWYRKLDRPTQKEVDILAEMLFMAEADEIVNNNNDTNLAAEMLAKIGVKCT
jgi:uncharacterized protein YukE